MEPTRLTKIEVEVRPMDKAQLILATLITGIFGIFILLCWLIFAKKDERASAAVIPITAKQDEEKKAADDAKAAADKKAADEKAKGGAAA